MAVYDMNTVYKALILIAVSAFLLVAGGCVSCIPQYTAPPLGPASACYPTGHDPFIPMDHNPSILNPWDALSSVSAPVLYGPPR